MIDIDEICRQIESNKTNIFALSTACGKKEKDIVEELYNKILAHRVRKWVKMSHELTIT
jgi:hypothetical protein